MYDASRSICINLPLDSDDFRKWLRLRVNSLTVEIPRRIAPDLTQLADLEGLAHLQIGGDYSGLVDLGTVMSTLPNLQTLAVNLVNYTISDFPPRLRDLRLVPFRSGVNLSGVKLNSLWIDGLRGVRDLRWLSGASLRRLVIQHAPDLNSLVGIPTTVSSIRVDYSPSLNDLRALGGLRLRSLEMHKCGDLQLPEGIETGLEELLLNECRSVSTLSPLVGATELRHLEFYGSTKVRDGKVAFLASLSKLSDLRFQNRAGYDCTREEIWDCMSRKQ